MVVFRCREENRAMSTCLSQYSSELEFEKYKLRRGAELDAAARTPADA